MEKQAHDSTEPDSAPAVLSDVATEPHPTAHAVPAPPGNSPATGNERLQEILPEINKLAQKVGGIKKLAEIIQQLDRAPGP
jgi:hypothetical protein